MRTAVCRPGTFMFCSMLAVVCECCGEVMTIVVISVTEPTRPCPRYISKVLLTAKAASVVPVLIEDMFSILQ